MYLFFFLQVIIKLKKKIIICLILSIFCISTSLANTFQNYKYYCPILIQISKNLNLIPINQSIHVQSNIVEIYYPKTIKFIGNVFINDKNHMLLSDQATIYENEKNQLKYLLYADGNIKYANNNILLSGKNASIDFYNKNIDLFQGLYFLKKQNFYGNFNFIMQRKNNKYTIIKNGSISTCIPEKNYWNITGSTIIYNQQKKNIDIWNAVFKIKQIPIFYSPYLSISSNNNSTFSTPFLPKIEYNKNGINFTIPYHLHLTKNYSINVLPHFNSKFGVHLQTKINYLKKPNKGLINFDFLENSHSKQKNKYFYPKNEKNWQLFWKQNITKKKLWKFDIDYTKINNFFDFKHTNLKNINTTTNYINQKFLCNYTNKHWDISLAHKKMINTDSEISNNYNYIASPQLEIYKYQKNNKLLNFYIFSQLTKFKPTNYLRPKAIRIHTEPIIKTTINNHWSKINIETRLKMTHYKQDNLYYCNNVENPRFSLQHTVNRIIPQFKIDGNINFEKLSYYKNIIEIQLQYFYTPYCYQNNIGIYDTNITYHYDNIYSFNNEINNGLDRITPYNQISNNIIIHIINKKHELFYGYIKQIFDLNQKNLNSIKKEKKIIQPIALLNKNYWKINNKLNIHTTLEYDIKNKQYSFGSTTLEHIKNKDQILQINHRYINKKYLKKKLSELNYPKYYENISQLGLSGFFPLINNWKIIYSCYQNLKTKKSIDYIIGIQHSTNCWNIHIGYEKKIIDWDKTLRQNLYDNKFLFNIKIHNNKNNNTTNLYKILNTNIFHYQKIHEKI